MNAHTVLAVIASTIVLGAYNANAHTPERRQGPHRQDIAVRKQQQQRCPQCGAPQKRRQGPRARDQYQQRGQYEHRRQQAPPPPFAPEYRRRAGPPTESHYAPQRQRGQQQPRLNKRQQLQRRRQSMLKRFDRDGDGRLSEQERKAMKKALRNKQQKSEVQPPQKPKAAPDKKQNYD